MKRLFILLFGIALIALGIYLIVHNNQLEKRCTVEVTGTVVDITREETTDSDGFTEHTYYPIIEYTANGETVSVKGNDGSNPSKYSIDDKIDLLYNPENVKEYMIKGDKSSQIAGIISIVVGVLLLGVGVKQLLLGR